MIATNQGKEMSLVLPVGDFRIMLLCDDNLGLGNGSIERTELVMYHKDEKPTDSTLTRELFKVNMLRDVTTDNINEAIHFCLTYNK